jgi:hypothetical protein
VAGGNPGGRDRQRRGGSQRHIPAMFHGTRSHSTHIHRSPGTPFGRSARRCVAGMPGQSFGRGRRGGRSMDRLDWGMRAASVPSRAVEP